jgi:hypothetical protein
MEDIYFNRKIEKKAMVYINTYRPFISPFGQKNVNQSRNLLPQYLKDRNIYLYTHFSLFKYYKY